jgi:cell division protease FtsH
MVTQYGMSDRFGLMGLETIQSRYLDGRPVLNCGEKTESEIDVEVMKILDSCHEKAKKIVEENKTVLGILAGHLIQKETITGKEFVKIFEEETGIKLKRKKEDGTEEEIGEKMGEETAGEEQQEENKV